MKVFTMIEGKFFESKSQSKKKRENMYYKVRFFFAFCFFVYLNSNVQTKWYGHLYITMVEGKRRMCYYYQVCSN